MNKLILCLLCSVTISMTACSDQTPPPDGRLPVSKTTKGAILGGAAGAGLGSLGHSAGAVAGGAVAGAALGAVIGYHIEKNDKKLEYHNHETGVQLVRHGSETKLIMPSDINFEANSTAVTPNYYPMLDGVADILDANPDTFIEVIGYSDNHGSTAANHRIAKLRAANVAHYIERQGISPSRINVISRGADSPLASNDTKQGRLENRRVVIKLWPGHRG